MIFTAVFDYAPNADGAVWFAQQVWPRVRAARPSARLTLAGSSPTGAVRRLAEDASIEVTGRVEDMRPYLWRSAVAVAPIFQSRGVQNKVLEAAAAGLPSVVTRTVGDGLPHQVLPACRIADTADAFAAAVIELLSLSPGRPAPGGGTRRAPVAWLADAAGAARRADRERRRTGARRHRSRRVTAAAARSPVVPFAAADNDQGRLTTGMSVLKPHCWAIPVA